MIGAPATGKSSFGARFVAEHPEYQFYPIDRARLEAENEPEAWEFMEAAIESRNDIIVETCGIGERLADLILEDNRFYRDPTFTAHFFANFHILKKRAKDRYPRRSKLFNYTLETELETIDHVQQHIGDVNYPINVEVNTGILDKEETYQRVTKTINLYGLQNGLG